MYTYIDINNIMQTPVQRFEPVPIILKFFGQPRQILQLPSSKTVVSFEVFCIYAMYMLGGEEMVMVKKQERAKIPI